MSAREPSRWPLSHEEVREWLDAQKFKFAKTSPNNPHSYIVRRNVDSRMFELVVLHIREHGYQQKWWRAEYTQYRAGDHHYWTMGGTLESTVILNRKSHDQAMEDERSGKGEN